MLLLLRRCMGTGIHGHTLKSAMTNAAKLNKMIESELARRQKRKTSIEMKHFNRMLLQKINLVKPQISIHDVSFTRAQVTSNYSEVRVFWKPRTNDQDEPALASSKTYAGPVGSARSKHLTDDQDPNACREN